MKNLRALAATRRLAPPMLLALLAGWVLTAGVPGLDLAPSGSAAATVVVPPASIPHDCSVSVSVPMTAWLASLSANTEVDVPSSYCYRVDWGVGIKVDGLTVNGGTWINGMTSATRGGSDGEANFHAGPVTGLTLENMTLEGENPGGFFPGLNDAGGIRLDGTMGAHITNVTIEHTYGDGIDLEPYRSPVHAGWIINPVEDLTVDNVTAHNTGRDAMALISVDDATIENVNLGPTGTGDIFNLEADQPNEGAENLTIDGCQTTFAAYFFANIGASNGQHTGNITVENCDIGYSDGVFIENLLNDPHPRGPYVFDDDTFHCNQSVYVPCIGDLGADVTVENSTLSTPNWAPHERLFAARQDATLTFTGDTVVGRFAEGIDAPPAVEVGEPSVPSRDPGHGTSPSVSTSSDPAAPGPGRPATAS